MFYTEKRLLNRLPYEMIILGIISVRLLSILPSSVSQNFMNLLVRITGLRKILK